MKRLLLVTAGICLSGCGGKSTDEWLREMRSSDAAIRLRAVKALGERGPEAEAIVPALAGALKDEEAFIRRDAAQSLGKIGPEARPAVAALLVALKDRKPAVRQEAARALQRIDPEAAAKAGVR
jgi:HEAT repeat protein